MPSSVKVVVIPTLGCFEPPDAADQPGRRGGRNDAVAGRRREGALPAGGGVPAQDSGGRLLSFSQSLTNTETTVDIPEAA